MTIMTREEYLAWKAAWKAKYKELSAEIRALKNAIAKSHKRGEYAGSDQAKWLHARNKAWSMLDELMVEKVRAGLISANRKLPKEDLIEKLLPEQIEIAAAALQERREAAHVASQAAAKARLHSLFFKEKKKEFRERRKAVAQTNKHIEEEPAA